MRCSVLEVSRMATDRLGSIVAFVRVAELGSFAKAAKALGISSSAVSKSVALATASFNSTPTWRNPI
jgi:hypothetical protein